MQTIEFRTIKREKKNLSHNHVRVGSSQSSRGDTILSNNPTPVEGNLPAPRSGSRTSASSRWILDDRPIRARRHRFQRENNEICSIIGRQFIVAEWFLLRLTTAGTEGAYEALEGRQSPVRRWAFFFIPLSRDSASASASWSSPRSTANREDLFPIGGPIVSFLFHLFASRTATRFLHPILRLLFYPSRAFSLFISPSSNLRRSSIRLRLRPRSPIRSTTKLFPSHLWSSLREEGEGIGVQVGSKRKRNRRRVDFRSANVVSLLMNFSVR